MNFNDTLEETYTALSANKARSGLTILGIVIGIASVIAMVAIGQGSQQNIQSSIQSLGSNLIEVMPGAARGQGFGVSAGRGSAKSLTDADAQAIAAQVQNVSAVTEEVSGRYQVTAVGTNTNTTVDGVTSSYPTVRNLQIDDGQFISDQDSLSISKVAVIGPTVMQDLYGTDTATSSVIGTTIRIKGLEFKVIGVTVSKGGSGFANQDNMIYVPAITAERYLAGNQYLTSIDIQAASANAMTQVQNDVTALLLQRHNISDPTQADFSVLNQNDLLGAVSSVSNTLTLLLASIAGISLIVGGIGIMNMMLTTVTERTREIGLRKAIGAKRADISNQFLAEAIALTLIGGIAGIVLGVAIAFGLSWLGIMQTSVSILSVVVAFGVSAGIGILFGWYPARRASQMNPIEALRYE
ncbi:MAG: ABC transporter permease [Patescibacteria group bacterium]|nr:ABC transporter permease [Patescibacteria group bacterium]